jgi:dihydroorotate dehydrogenase
MVKDVSVELRKKGPLVACGGIFTGRDVFELIGCGADACEVFTSFVYRGPLAARKIKTELAEEMSRKGFRSIEDLKGALVR